jgi:hypothetical protein
LEGSKDKRADAKYLRGSQHMTNENEIERVFMCRVRKFHQQDHCGSMSPHASEQKAIHTSSDEAIIPMPGQETVEEPTPGMTDPRVVEEKVILCDGNTDLINPKALENFELIYLSLD